MTHREALCRVHKSDFTLPGAEAHYPPDLELEPTHLDITLRLRIREQRVEGHVLTRVVARRPGARGLSLKARGFEDLSVEDADGHPLGFRYDGRTIQVSWPFHAERLPAKG